MEFNDEDLPTLSKMGEFRDFEDFEGSVNKDKGEEPTQAPQITRIPVFSAGNQERETRHSPSGARYVPPSSAPSGMRSPVRPSSTKPSSRAGKRPISVENRVLLKLASTLPQDGDDINGLGRLPEARAALVKLNGELDAIVNEIRLMEAAQNRFSFSMALEASMPTDQTILNMEHGVAMYDAIISDLSGQAFKKVTRIKSFYSKFIARQRLDYEEDVSQLQLKIQELQALAHESALFHSPAQQENQERETENKSKRPKVTISIPEESESVVYEPSSPKTPNHAATSPKASNNPSAAKNLHNFVLNRLDVERQMAKQQIDQLQDTLLSTQEELRKAQDTIQELTAQLVEKETEQLGAEQYAVKQLQILLKELKPSTS